MCELQSNPALVRCAEMTDAQTVLDRLKRESIAYADAFIAALPGGSGDRLRGIWIARRVGAWGGGNLGASCMFDAPERMRFGRGVTIGPRSFFASSGGMIVVGDRVSFNTNVHVNASMGGEIRFGSDCLVGPNVVLRTANHCFDRSDVPIREQGHSIGDIVIENDVWLGANVTVLGGVTIGRGTVITAGAVVNRDIPSMVVAGGVPANVLKTRASPSES